MRATAETGRKDLEYKNGYNILVLRMLIYTHSGQSSQTDKDKHGAENRFALRSVSTNITMIVNLLSVTMQDKESHQ